MNKAFVLLLLFILSLGVVSGCAENNDNETNSNESENNNLNNSSAPDENEEVNHSEMEEGAPDDQGEAKVWIEAAFTVTENGIEIIGETNIEPGAQLYINPSSPDYTITSSSHEVVEENGSFTASLPSFDIYDSEIIIDIEFSLENDSNENFRDIYGEHGEKIEGDYVRIEEDADGNMSYKAMASASYEPVEGEEQLFETATPNWVIPEDYGELEVWMDAEFEKQDEHFYISVTSNLKENTPLNAQFDLPDYIVTGYQQTEPALPDGSANFRLDYPEPINNDDTEAYINISVDLSEMQNYPSLIEHYGENGENFNREISPEDDSGKIIILVLQIQ